MGSLIAPAELAARLRTERHILAITHEAPDGDALGCLSALLMTADTLQIKADGYVPGETPFPDEYSFLPRLEQITRGPLPAVSPPTTVYLLDCASLLRSNGHELSNEVVRINIDHHQDNPHYGDLNLVEPTAPSTTAILYEVFKAGGFPVDVDIATALYVGLVTDTGRFQYSNTTPIAHRVAAELQEAGVDVNAVYRKLYENVPLPKLMLLQRALGHLTMRLEGQLVISWLEPEDFVHARAEEGHAEGIIDTMRTIQGVRVAALIKNRSTNTHKECKVSLRSTDGSVNVAAIAAEWGGGGHVRAAGFTCKGEVAEVATWIEEEVRKALG